MHSLEPEPPRPPVTPREEPPAAGRERPDAKERPAEHDKRIERYPER